MCSLKVANRRGIGSDLAQFPSGGAGDGDGDTGGGGSSSSDDPHRLLYGQRDDGDYTSGVGEFSTIVSTLTNVMSGQAAPDWSYGGGQGFVSSSSSASGSERRYVPGMSYWVGQKRMREEEISVETQHDFDSVSRGFSFRGFEDHISHSQQGQSSNAPGSYPHIPTTTLHSTFLFKFPNLSFFTLFF